MNYSLGNMLGGAGAINPDKLALNLQFATDKTLTARKGPTPVFTRASGATQVGASGLIEFAPENLYAKSQEFNDVYWTKSGTTVTANAITAPDGTLTADKIVEDTSTANHSIRSTVTPIATPHTFSVFAKKGERIWLVLRYGGVNDFFNLDTGIATTNNNSPTITNFGNGWYRCTVTGTSATQAFYQISTDGSTTSYTGDGASGIYLWGAQLEQYSSARAYLPTTTAAVYGARFDHDPITLACKGLLIEESRTNLCNQSGNVGAWAGTFTNSGSTTAPDGTSAGYLAGIGTGEAQTLATPNVTGLHTASVFLKRNNTDWIRLQTVQGANANIVNLWVNLDTATIGTLSVGAGTPTSLSAQITPAGNGWYRCSVTASYPATSYISLRLISATADNSVTRVAGSIYGVWGAQIEAGAFPTSYIPTTTASVVRSADVCSISGSDFTGIYNATEGTLLVSADEFRRGTSFGSILRIADSVLPTNNRYSIGAFGSKTGVASPLEFIVASAAITQYTATPTSTTSNFKAALAYKVDDMRGAVNGVLATADTPPSALIVTANTINISGVGIHIASVRYYKKRLANAKLQALTA